MKISSMSEFTQSRQSKCARKFIFVVPIGEIRCQAVVCIVLVKTDGAKAVGYSGALMNFCVYFIYLLSEFGEI